MLGQRKHHEGFDFVPGNHSLSAVEVGLVNVMSRKTVLLYFTAFTGNGPPKADRFNRPKFLDFVKIRGFFMFALYATQAVNGSNTHAQCARMHSVHTRQPCTVFAHTVRQMR